MNAVKMRNSFHSPFQVHLAHVSGRDGRTEVELDGRRNRKFWSRILVTGWTRERDVAVTQRRLRQAAHREGVAGNNSC